MNPYVVALLSILFGLLGSAIIIAFIVAPLWLSIVAALSAAAIAATGRIGIRIDINVG